MQTKTSWKSIGLGLAFVFTLLFPSIHEVEHFKTERAIAVCIHDPSSNKNELTHQHASLKACAVCAFSLSPLQVAEQNFYPQPSLAVATKITIFYSEHPGFFSGSFYSLRGPPRC
ncbi:MAG: hypothetical protein NTX74_01150 [Flavobacterium sp.]|jgi:hypothetical protein|nr:hypothetical protein [Flavobacterium sp.]